MGEAALSCGGGVKGGLTDPEDDAVPVILPACLITGESYMN